MLKLIARFYAESTRWIRIWKFLLYIKKNQKKNPESIGKSVIKNAFGNCGKMIYKDLKMIWFESMVIDLPIKSNFDFIVVCV